MPAQLQGLLELQAAHAGAPVYQSPQLLIVPGVQVHPPLVPAQPGQALQMDQPCISVIVSSQSYPASQICCARHRQCTYNQGGWPGSI